MTVLERTDAANLAFQMLIARLDRFLTVHNGERDGFYAGHNRVDPATRVVVATIDGEAVGCGALRPIDAETAEVKRMFVVPEARGHGLGLAILGELEAWAADLGHHRLILETSRRLDAAVGLYHDAGYTDIPNYPPYEDVADSVCMAKALTT